MSNNNTERKLTAIIYKITNRYKKTNDKYIFIFITEYHNNTYNNFVNYMLAKLANRYEQTYCKIFKYTIFFVEMHLYSCS